MQTWSLVSICVLIGVVVRWGVSLNSYSGMKCVYPKISLWKSVCCPTVYFRVPFSKNFPGGDVTHFINPLLVDSHFVTCVFCVCHSLTWAYIA